MMRRADRGRNCGTCDFWQPKHVPVDALSLYDGHCHRQPPVRTDLGNGMWPPTDRGGWCGEYAAAPDIYADDQPEGEHLRDAATDD